MVRGDKVTAAYGGRAAERSLGQLGLRTGEVTGGSSDSPPRMCLGRDPWDCHDFHALNKTGALKKTMAGKTFSLHLLR